MFALDFGPLSTYVSQILFNFSVQKRHFQILWRQVLYAFFSVFISLMGNHLMREFNVCGGRDLRSGMSEYVLSHSLMKVCSSVFSLCSRLSPIYPITSQTELGYINKSYKVIKKQCFSKKNVRVCSSQLPAPYPVMGTEEVNSHLTRADFKKLAVVGLPSGWQNDNQRRVIFEQQRKQTDPGSF